MKHPLDKTAIAKDGFIKNSVKIDRENRPAESTLKLQRRSHDSRSARKVKEFVRIERGVRA